MFGGKVVILFQVYLYFVSCSAYVLIISKIIIYLWSFGHKLSKPVMYVAMRLL